MRKIYSLSMNNLVCRNRLERFSVVKLCPCTRKSLFYEKVTFTVCKYILLLSHFYAGVGDLMYSVFEK